MRRYIPVLFAVLMLGACGSDPHTHAPEPPRPLPHVDYYPHPPEWTSCVDKRDAAGCMGRLPPQQ
ncbi:MAG TPA: hypothetical protein VL625_11695 [Patescibacteria group bacterium]|jgi:hypothetical protein|nr:hypothetical protein [Patescibacteria group bacterium]